MAIMSLSTEIPAVETVALIEEMLVSHGALDVRKRYGQGRPRPIEGIGFTLQTPGGIREYVVPTDVERTARAIAKERGILKSQRTPEHARNVAWRIAFRWLQVTLALVDVGYTSTAAAVSSFEEVAPGVALFQAVESGQQVRLMLPQGRAR